MLGFLVSFLPWILYGVIANTGFVRDELAAVIALLCVLILDFKRLKKGYVLEWGTVIYFATLLIAYCFPIRALLAGHAMTFANVALAAIMWLSIAIRKPFTIQYAKETVPAELWNKPGFVRVNDIISAVWAVAVTIGIFTPTWVGVVALLLAIKFTRWFPGWYQASKR